MLILEIAAGIVLAFVVLAWWREIAALGFAYAIGIAAFTVAVYALDALGLLHLISQAMPWLVIGGVPPLALLVAYYAVAGVRSRPDSDAIYGEQLSRFSQWVQRITIPSLFLLFGGGVMMWALSTVGIIR